MKKISGANILSVLITCALVVTTFGATVFADENDNENENNSTDVQIENDEEISEEDSDVDIEEEESDSEVDQEVSETSAEDDEDIAEEDVPAVIDETIPKDDTSEDQVEESLEADLEDEEHPDIILEYYGETSIIPYEDEYSKSVSANYGTVSYGSGMYKKQFSDVDEATYDILTSKIALVANGQLLDTQFLIDLDDIGFDNEFTAEELGIDYIFQNGESYPNLGNIVFNQITCDWSPVLHRLLVEYPYELYWFDKTSSTGIRMSTPSMGLVWDSNLKDYVVTYDGGLIYYFPVCEAYAEDDFLVDINQTTRAKNASNYAKRIVAQNAGLTDIDKLNKYKEVICDLVDYNTPAAENSDTPYGDPWNLVYVFDRDPNTKVVCEGYSKAFKYLCDLSSFENSDLTCILASGYFQSSNTYGPHMWNIVSFGEGLNYMVDVTNCDYGTIGAPNYLFLRNVDSGSASNTYTYTLYIYGRTNNLYYTYKTETLDLYNIEPLTINTSPLFDAPEVILSATCSGIELQWLKEHTAYSYDIYRRTSNSMWSLVTNTTNNSYTDTTVTANMQYYYCIVCKNANGEKMNQFDDQYTITAVTHSIVVDQAVPVTCTTDGLTEGSHCSTCGKIIVAQQVIEAKGHTVVVDPAITANCEHAGLTEGSHCSVCNQILAKQQVIPATEHAIVVDKGYPATCTEPGLTDGQHCSVCGLVLASQRTIAAAGHIAVIDPAKEPTDTEPGLTEGSHCAICGAILVKQEVIGGSVIDKPDIDKNDLDFDVSTRYDGEKLTINVVFKNPEMINMFQYAYIYYRSPDMDDWIYKSQTNASYNIFKFEIHDVDEGVEYSYVVGFFNDNDTEYALFDKHFEVVCGNQESPSTILITKQPSDFSGKAGKTAKFTVEAQGVGLTYKWQANKSGNWVDSSLPGAKTDTLSVDVMSSRNGYQFRCIVTDGHGNSVISNEATLNVNPAVSITSQPKDYSGITGDTATFNVIATGTGLTYQWQTFTNGSWRNSSLPGAKTDTLSVLVTDSRNGYKFRCVIKDAIGNSITSGEVTLNVTPSFKIDVQPADYNAPVGKTALFTVIASGTGLTYQWQAYTNGSWKNSSLPGAKTNTLSVLVTNARNGYKFRCIIKDVSGHTITSNETTLTVSSPVIINTQPADYSGSEGGTAKFTVVATGNGLTYQWQAYVNGVWKNSSLPGYNNSTLSVGVINSRNGYKFRCVIKDANGYSVTSDEASLIIIPAIKISSDPSDYQGPVGSTAIFSVMAEGDGLTYQWQAYTNGSWKNSSLPGAKTDTLSVAVISSRNGYKFRCVIKNSAGATITTKEVTLNVG